MRIPAFLLIPALLHGATRAPVPADRAMVVAAERQAAEIGREVLQSGGNAVDAAVAVGMTMAVTYPLAGNIGGGGFMLIRFADGRSTFIDFREMAPAAATREMYLDADGEVTDESVIGYRASGVPGTVRGLAMALEKYGTKRWADLIRPARLIADRGWTVTPLTVSTLTANTRLEQFVHSKRIFLNGGDYFKRGDLLRQRDLARTFRRMEKKGPDEFYTGETARLIARDMAANGGLITLKDLNGYEPKERRPIEGDYRGYSVLSAPPPSSGGAGVVQMLHMLESSDYFEAGPGSAAAIHHVAEVQRRFFADRAAYFGDTDFVEIPLEKLISQAYARRRAESIDPEHATPSSEIHAGLGDGKLDGETTHYSVVDAMGNAVAVTYTLNGLYGSGVTVAGTGILLNNEMDDFTSKPGSPNMFGLLQSENNAIEPKKRPLSAMTPTILAKDGKVIYVLGSPGGPTIINTVFETILNLVDFDMNLQQAVDFPRFHHQWMPDELRLESYGFSPDTIRLLEERGHKIRMVSRQGRVMAIEVNDDGLLGAADARSEGLAAGY